MGKPAVKAAALFILMLLPWHSAALSSERCGEDACVVAGAFSSGAIPPGWDVFKFSRVKKETVYAVVEDEGAFVLKAASASSASALNREINGELQGYPVMEWRWKVLEGAASEEKDDYPARVYVNFEYEPEKASFFERFKRRLLEAALGTKLPGTSLNYVWAGRLKKGEVASSPFTKKVAIMALESGAAAGWADERRDVVEDYRKCFGAEPPRITGIGILTDTDATGSEASALYGDIIFKKRQADKERPHEHGQGRDIRRTEKHR